MGDRVVDVAPRQDEVPMIEGDVVKAMSVLRAQGRGFKHIARVLGIARNTVRHYLRDGAVPETQVRPAARVLDDEAQARAVALFESTAEGNAVVVQQLLRDEGHEASARTVQRAVEGTRQIQRAEQLATVRFETPPGRQMQIDFGQKLVQIAGQMVKVFFLTAVLGYSRRLFVKAFLAERHDDWREGVVGAFERFGGVPLEGWVAEALPGVGPLIIPVDDEEPLPAAGSFRTVLLPANVRRTPGYVNKPADDALGYFRPKTVVNVQGDPRPVDNLVWWQTGGITATGAAAVGLSLIHI